MPTDLSSRLGETPWQRRYSVETSAKHLAENRILVAPPVLHPFWVIRHLLSLTGLMPAAHRQFLNPVLEHNTCRLASLPKPLDGFTILQLTDLHIELDPALAPVIKERIKDLRYDLCVFTGDFQQAFDAGESAVTHLSSILGAIHAPAYAIPGNHDTTDIITCLEDVGLPFLLNEHIPIKHNGTTFHLCGIDDPIYFRSHDLTKARKGLPAESFSILLSHSATTAEQAATLGYSLLLCGHTHGGQICLPGGIPIAKGSTPRPRVKGSWQYGNLLGYTSRGVGASHIPARLFCPPEITLHTLRTI